MFRMANRIMALLFLTSAALQFNDPDPWRWIAIYGAAGFACIAVERSAGTWPIAAGVGLAAIVWAVRLSPILPDVQPSDLVKTMHADTPTIELGREFLGLSVLAVWLVTITIVSMRANRQASGA